MLPFTNREGIKALRNDEKYNINLLHKYLQKPEYLLVLQFVIQIFWQNFESTPIYTLFWYFQSQITVYIIYMVYVCILSLSLYYVSNFYKDHFDYSILAVIDFGENNIRIRIVAFSIWSKNIDSNDVYMFNS